MKVKRTRFLVTLLSVFMAFLMLLGMGGGLLGRQTAHAAEYAATSSGWYIVGNGAGTLKNCSWTQYNSSFKLTGTSYDASGATYQNYLGFWKTDSILLYEGDQFKFLYNNGSWSNTDSSGWGSAVVADYSNIADNVGSAFSSVGVDNIQVNKGHSGYYTFYLYVTRTATNQLAVTLTFYYDSSKTVPKIDLFDMYVVGDIASVPNCGWASQINVAKDGIKMTYSAQSQTWLSAVVYLVPSDQFRVYNLVNHGYYPSAKTNLTVSKAGWYYLSWKEFSQTVDIIPLSQAGPTHPDGPSGWYVVGNGAGDLKNCSWLEYLPDWQMDGEVEGEAENGYTNYLGVFWIENLLLYEGDQMQFLYNDGTWIGTGDSGWAAAVKGNFSNLTDNTDSSFIDGGFGNLEARLAGYYAFYVEVIEEEGGVTIYVSFELVSTDVPAIDLYDMYVVGSIASVPTCGWPDYVGDVAENCIKMTYNATTKKWTTQVNLIPRDEFKVYNTVSNTYYPRFMDNNKTGYAAGLYEIEWEDNAPDILVTLIYAYE